MIGELGCTGYVSFDFMEQDGQMLLLECNPRPVPVSHLGGRLGVDHAEELARLLRGVMPCAEPLTPLAPLDVLLFPYALDRTGEGTGRFVDVPFEDPGLLRFVKRANVERPVKLAAPVPQFA